MRKTSKAVGRKMRRSNVKKGKRMVRRFTQHEWASASQTLELPDDQTRQVYSLGGIRLSDFDRLSMIARAYQYFRITHVEVKFRPFFDTYSSTGAAGAQTVPYLYWLINKSQNNRLASFNALQDAGAKPIRFDDKTITVRWKPAVLQYIRDVNTEPANIPNWTMSKVSPWLATSQVAGDSPSTQTFVPNSVEHTGILYGVNTTTGLAAAAYGITISVHCQFKKPLNQPAGDREDAAIEKKIVPKDYNDLEDNDLEDNTSVKVVV